MLFGNIDVTGVIFGDVLSWQGIIYQVTYSPLFPAAQSDPAPNLTLQPATLLSRVSCLLHCPADTPQLWPQVLSVLVSGLDCSGAQLFLPTATGYLESDRYSWGVVPFSAQPDPAQPDLAQTGSAQTEVAQLWHYLEQHLGMALSTEEVNLWQQSLADSKAQLAALVTGGIFHLAEAYTYDSRHWPAPLAAIFGAHDNRYLILQPLYPGHARATKSWQGTEPHAENAAGQSCLGVLALWRQASGSAWSPREIHQVAAAGSQIYLAIRRSHIDRVARYRSACDQLTELPDRVMFGQQLTRSIAHVKEKDTMLGVAFLDLDRFKNINDTLGHEAGDCLIQQVARRLQSCLRGYDVVARWGGDEFTLLLCDLRSPEDISLISERILQRLAAPFYVQGQELYVTASLGIALAPYDGEDEQTLLRNADAAMYQAKNRGRNNYQIYFEEINADARNQLNLETDLRKAIGNNELFLCYQPQVELRTGRWIGLEALIRWQHPSLGLIPPSRFIPIAEETGLIEPIGHWVLQAACHQYSHWRQAGLPQLRLAVNLSAQQFHRSSLVRSVMQVLNSTHFDPRYLELEVTESAAMQDVGFAIEVLKKLSHAGIQIAMDDFGTGYSSLSVLKHFPLDTIKIDRSFVMDLVNSPSDAAIASTIIALAKGLNFKVLAEGIETPEQVSVLSAMGCDYAQGYWFSRPLAGAKIDELLACGKFCEIAKCKAAS